MDFSVDLSKKAEEKWLLLPELQKIKLALMLKDVIEKYIEMESSEIDKRKSMHDFSQRIKPK
ncbi:MAG: hypothetical protein V4671_15340 [Armatimonadota bacterium]